MAIVLSSLSFCMYRGSRFIIGEFFVVPKEINSGYVFWTSTDPVIFICTLTYSHSKKLSGGNSSNFFLIELILIWSITILVLFLLQSNFNWFQKHLGLEWKLSKNTTVYVLSPVLFRSLESVILRWFYYQENVQLSFTWHRKIIWKKWIISKELFWFRCRFLLFNTFQGLNLLLQIKLTLNVSYISVRPRSTSFALLFHSLFLWVPQ